MSQTCPAPQTDNAPQTSPAPHTTGQNPHAQNQQSQNRPELPQFVDTLVIGGGIGGLVAARQASKMGKTVALIEERGQVGGLVAPGTMAGYTFDIGAESYATRAAEVTALCDELGLERDYPTGTSWLYDRGQVVALPKGTFGIPTSVDDPAFVSALTALRGRPAVERARQDRDLPPTVGAEAQTLAELVTARLGKDTLEAIVGPFASAIHGAHPRDLPLERVTPGLKETMLRVGTLTGAVASLRTDSAGQPRPAVAQTRGGMYQLTRALAADITARGGLVLPRVTALHIVAGVDADAPRWAVWVKRTHSNPTPGGPPVPEGSATPIGCNNLVIATDARTAQPLLRSAVGSAVRLEFHQKRAGRVPVEIFAPAVAESLGTVLTEMEFPPAVPVCHHTLVVRCPELDTHPRGSGVLVSGASNVPGAPGYIRAKALTHYNSKWPGTVSPVLEEGVHVLRVSYGRDSDAVNSAANTAEGGAGAGSTHVAAGAGNANTTGTGTANGTVSASFAEGRADALDAPLSVALADASKILGVTLREEDLLDHRYIAWGTSLRPPTGQLARQIDQIRAGVQATPGLALAGAWVAGTGISAVVKHAQAL